MELLSICMLYTVIMTINSVGESGSVGYCMSVVVYRIEREMTLGVAEISQRLLIGRLTWLLCKTYVQNKYGNSRNPLSYVWLNGQCRSL